jgi:hypothetical protein
MADLTVAEARQQKRDSERLWQLQYDRGVRNHGYLSTLMSKNDRMVEEAKLVEKLSGNKPSSGGSLHFSFRDGNPN